VCTLNLFVHISTCIWFCVDRTLAITNSMTLCSGHLFFLLIVPSFRNPSQWSFSACVRKPNAFSAHKVLTTMSFLCLFHICIYVLSIRRHVFPHSAKAINPMHLTRKLRMLSDRCPRKRKVSVNLLSCLSHLLRIPPLQFLSNQKKSNHRFLLVKFNPHQSTTISHALGKNSIA
jgi:hypothetical protein